MVYIDGFNFYYGMVRNTRNKWCDLQSLFEKMRQDDDVLKVYYFSSRAKDAAGQRQDVYFRALRTLPKVEIVLGRFKTMNADCGVRECKFGGNRRYAFDVEKRTDVNIAVQLMADAYKDRADVFVVVSGDSDLAPALAHVKTEFPAKRLVAYIPARNIDRAAATEIRNAAHKDSTLSEGIVATFQLPNPVTTPDGKKIFKPSSW